LVCAVRRQQVCAQDEEQREDEYKKGYDHFRLHLLEKDAWQLQAASLQPFGEPWTNTRRAEAAEHLALLIDTRSLVLENLLHRDRLAFHAGDFRDGSNAARTVRHARDLHDKVQSRCDLLPHRAV